jgi:enterobactin synthetase component D
LLSNIGIDAERLDRVLKPGIDRYVRTSRERDLRDGNDLLYGPASVTLATFSAKESVYKCLAPLARRRIGFHEVELDFDVGTQSFRASATSSSLDDFDLGKISGKFTVCGEFLITAAYIEAGSKAE